MVRQTWNQNLFHVTAKQDPIISKPGISSTKETLVSSALKHKGIKRQLIQESTELLDSAIHEIRQLSKNQITPQVKLGLRELIQVLVDSMKEKAPVKTTFDYEVGAHTVNADLKLNIYRIIQEQINNILKHARATQVHILLKTESGFIIVMVSDNGKGFQLRKKRKGIGITNMINRVESYNGEFSLESEPGKGCRLHVRLPL
jgi:signal transduction histidine kinase